VGRDRDNPGHRGQALVTCSDTVAETETQKRGGRWMNRGKTQKQTGHTDTLKVNYHPEKA